MSGWNPAQYLKFGDERTRAARDLLAQVPLARAGKVYDLGCGPGNSTALLVERFRQAQVTGIDNSQAMLRAAEKACPAARYALADLASWAPEQGADLLFSNAAFQWVPRHLDVLERLAGTLAPGGALAVQMPDNLAEPSHRLMQETAENGPWAEKLARAALARDPLPAPDEYYARLKPRFSRLDIWHTIYNHTLDGPRGIADWVKGTGLRPYLEPLSESGKADYLAAYTDRLAQAYPVQQDGKSLLRFPRLFMVGVR